MPIIFRWETVTYVSSKSARALDYNGSRYYIRRASRGSRTFIVSKDQVLYKQTFKDVAGAMEFVEALLTVEARKNNAV